ncbi:MAG: hypothetical protein ACLGSD_04930 [Acidobacteriota bacterium]
MKKFAFALAALIGLLVVISYNVWRAAEEPVTSTPGPVEVGRAQLHAQLVDAEQREGAAEKQAWNSPVKLQTLLKWHQDRIAKLAGNTQAGEILAYDRAAVDRLQKRIADLAAQQAAQAKAAEAAAKAARQQH